MVMHMQEFVYEIVQNLFSGGLPVICQHDAENPQIGCPARANTSKVTISHAQDGYFSQKGCPRSKWISGLQKGLSLGGIYG